MALKLDEYLERKMDPEMEISKEYVRGMTIFFESLGERMHRIMMMHPKQITLKKMTFILGIIFEERFVRVLTENYRRREVGFDEKELIYLKKYFFPKKNAISHDAFIMFISAFDYMCSDITELASNSARDSARRRKKLIVTYRDLAMVVLGDGEYTNIFRDLGIMFLGNKTPNIHSNVLPKKRIFILKNSTKFKIDILCFS